PSEVRQEVAELLQSTFPKALRETLKEDFAKDGKAFAGLTLQLLTGMQAQLRQLQTSQGGVNPEELAQILEQFQDLETQLRGSITQQQEFFRDVSRGIESGFAEVCQELRVIETTITQLLQTLEERIEELHKEVRQGFKAMQNQPRGRSLSPEEWQDVCRQNLAVQKQVTTNPFTNSEGVTAALEDIYVPLAILERKASKRVLTSEQEPQKKSQETLTPIAEESFFEDVLRQSKSAISQGRKIAIIGEPGSGKTTRLQKIADWVLEQGLGLPIFIYLRDVDQGTITEHIETVWLKQTGQGLTIEALLEQKERIWVLLDGLDEMTTRLETRHVSAWLGGWVQDVRVVVTCRVNVWEADQNAFSGFDVFRNLELNGEQVGDYIRCWFGVMGDGVKGEGLVMALGLSENARLRELVQNPLRLWMLCQIWDMGGVLPETQAALYEQFVNWVYRWKGDEAILDEREGIDGALARLALAAMEGEDEGSRLRLREGWVLKVLGSRSIFRAVEMLGWLNRVERFPEAIYVFYHATFQEYFAALAVEDWDYFLPRNHVDCPVEGKRYRIFEPQWKQVIFLWLGRWDIEANYKLEFVIKLATFKDECQMYRVKSFFVAAEGISQLKDIDTLIPYKKYDQFSLTSALIDKLVGLALWDFDVQPKRWSIYDACFQQDAREILKRTTRSKVIAILEQKLNSISVFYSMNSVFKGKTQTEVEAQFKEICPDTVMADLAANNMRCLEEMRVYLESTGQSWGGDGIFFHFVSFLYHLDPHNQSLVFSLPFLIANTENPGSRLNAINWLLTVDPDHPALVEGLVKTMITALEWRDRDEAAQILGKVNPGNPFIMNWLLELLEANQNENSRWQIAYHLGLVDPGNTQAKTVLLEIIETTQSEDIRWFLAQYLEKYEPDNPGAIAVLLKIIETANHEDIIRQAFQTLEEIGKEHPDTIAGLLKIIKTSKHEDIISQAIWILRKIGNTDIIADLLEFIETANHEDIINRAFWTLVEIGKGNPDAISGLLKLIESTENENIIHQAFRTLDKIGKRNPDAISGLLKIIETTDNKKIINETFFTLWQIGKDNPDVIASLLKIIETTDNEDTRCQAACSLQKIEPGNLCIIPALTRVIETTDNEDTRCEAAQNLQEIDPGNPHVIPALVRVIETTDNEDTRCEAAQNLQEIDPGNPHVIPALVRVIETTDNEDTLYVAKYLHRIDPENPHLISALVRVVETTDNEDTCWKVAEYLYEIDPGNYHVIPALVSIIETTDNEDTAKMAVKTFRNFELNHPEAISVLSKLIQSISNTNILEEVAYSLGIINPGNLQAIDTLIKLAEISENETVSHYSYQFRKSWKGNDQAITRLLELIIETADNNTLNFASEILEKVGKGNYLAISGLMKILQTNANSKIRTYAAYGLAEIDPKNYLVISELLKALEANQEEYIQWQLAWQLGKVDPSNQRATECVLRIMETNDSHYILRELDQHLKKIEWGSHLGISVFVKLLQISRDKPYEESPIYSLFHSYQTFDDICYGSTLATSRLIELIQSDYLEGDYSLYFEYLKRTIANREQKEMIISALHSHLSDETYTDNFNLYLECYKLFWDISQDLPYPEFYQAWHNPPTTPHPEVEDNTPVASTPFTQQCNLALLPQILNQANQSHPLNCQIICIDGSRFSDPSNPTLQIYPTLKKAGCPASPDGKPDTIAKLQAYCEDDLSNQAIALILYEEPTNPPPQGFDMAVLNQLARFSHPPIALVVPDRLAECRLPQFLESDPNLVTTILQWLQNLER
ncbi:MAG: HEAT repeat domain-containing protein, partial [Planktothrix sp.]